MWWERPTISNACFISISTHYAWPAVYYIFRNYFWFPLTACLNKNLKQFVIATKHCNTGLHFGSELQISNIILHQVIGTMKPRNWKNFGLGSFDKILALLALSYPKNPVAHIRRSPQINNVHTKPAPHCTKLWLKTYFYINWTKSDLMYLTGGFPWEQDMV